MSLDLDPYYSRHDKDRDVLASATLIVIGMALGMVLLMVARSCDRPPMPAVVGGIIDRINCQHCHGVRLDNGKRYARYWKERRRFDQRTVASAHDDDIENERMMNLIVGAQND